MLINNVSNKWSVIMLSHLGQQKESPEHLVSVGKRLYGEEKFINAVESFIYQDYPNKELVIVSDGCEITNRLYHLCYSDRDDIKLVMMPKSPPPPPPNRYRHAGIVAATGDRICYLDTDDCFFPFHLTNLEASFPEDDDWVGFPYRIMAEEIEDSSGAPTLRMLKEIDLTRSVPNAIFRLKKEPGYIGGGNIAHRRTIKTHWGGDLKIPGRNGDERWIMELIANHPNHTIFTQATMGYILCQSRTINCKNNIVKEVKRTPTEIIKKFNYNLKR